MRFFKTVAKLFTCSGLIGLVVLCASASVGCGEAEFKCCQCTFSSCLDATGNPAAQDVCTCDRAFTYEDCGLYCTDELAPQLYNQGLTNCGKPSNSYAKDVCEVGTPVG